MCHCAIGSDSQYRGVSPSERATLVCNHQPHRGRRIKMDKPTEAQREEFWEWCGFTTGPFAPQYSTPEEPDPEYVYDPEGKECEFPPIDLNNLFKYAVPLAITKLMDKNVWTERRAIHYLFQAWEIEYSNNKVFEDALFWVLWQVKEEK